MISEKIITQGNTATNNSKHTFMGKVGGMLLNIEGLTECSSNAEDRHTNRNVQTLTVPFLNFL